VYGRATAVSYLGDVFTVTTSAGKVHGDMLLIAAGRSPVVQGLGLERSGVRYTPEGIAVNAHLRTTARNIYAAGDVLGGPQYSHLAGWQGFQATRNALLPGKSLGTPRAMPRVTFTSPEVARVGLTEQQARRKYGDKLQAGTLALTRIDRAVSEDDAQGFLKLLALTDGRILGGTFVGERASEAITVVVVAIDRGIRLQHLAGVVHPTQPMRSVCSSSPPRWQCSARSPLQKATSCAPCPGSTAEVSWILGKAVVLWSEEPMPTETLLPHEEKCSSRGLGFGYSPGIGLYSPSIQLVPFAVPQTALWKRSKAPGARLGSSNANQGGSGYIRIRSLPYYEGTICSRASAMMSEHRHVQAGTAFA